MKKSLWAKFFLKLEQDAPVEGSTTTESTALKDENPNESSSEESANLRKALEKERDRARSIEKELKKNASDLKAFQERFANIDPSQYEALLKERETLATKQSEQERYQAELAAKFETDRIKLTETHSSQMKILEQERSALQEQILSLTRSQLLEKEFAGANGRSEISDGISYFQVLDQFVGSKFKLSEDRKTLIVVGDDGSPMASIEDPKATMTPKEYLKSLHRHEVLGSCFKLDSVPSGSGQNLPTRTNGGIPSKILSRSEQLVQARRGG